jgi:hypothetical protein
MSDILELALAAHGGLDRWNAQRTVCVEASVGGALWDSKRKTGLFETFTYEADTHIQKAVIGGFGAPGGRVHFTPTQLVVEDAAGRAIALRDNPREAFAGHTGETPWDDLHAAYFNGYALWTYLTQPFLYTYPRFETTELEPWEEAGETWRRLKVVFPDEIASHTREQVTYFGPDGLMRRHDYAVDVLGGAEGAHYIGDYRDHGGLLAPHRRRVHPRGADNQKIDAPILVSIDIARLRYTPA